MLETYLERIRQATREARSETGLQIKLEAILAELLREFGITYKPFVNETLKSQGLSQADSTRPDSLFGHVVLDYKAPDLLSSARELSIAKGQIERYLNSSTGGRTEEGLRWAGILWDGASLCFCHSEGDVWIWSNRVDVSEASLLTLVARYRALQRKPLTAHLLALSFGKESAVAQDLLSIMCSHLSKPKHRTTMLFREWKRLFEQVSTYGLDQLPTLKAWAKSLGIATKDASQILFAIHSHYALVVKLLTSELLAAVNPLSTTSLCERIANAKSVEQTYEYLAELEDGDYWRRYRISNFLEGDFFSWYTNERSRALATAIQAIAREFLQFEPATVIVRPEVMRDLLKEFYTTLVDEQIRHDLGEYYTPDWLAQRVLDRIDYHGDPDLTVLDPACGSGTFLIECIARLRRTARERQINGRDLLNIILERIRGMDLNPLAVISARANFILSIADLVFTVGEDVELPIYLADCINVPIGKEAKDGLDVLEFSLDTEKGRFRFEIPEVLVQARVFGKILLACEDAIKQKRSGKSFLQAVRVLPGASDLLEQRVEARLTELFEIVAKLEDQDWNRIWCRIVKQNFSPNGFGEIDILVGNPPWVRWSRLPQTYRERVKDFCNYYGLVSGKGYSGGIETDISTVVLYSAADHWLKVGGKVGLLITWTVFKSASARGFRLGTLPNDTGLHVTEIANLTGIQPFPDATNETSIYVATKVAPAGKETNRALIRTLREDEFPIAQVLDDPVEGVWIEADLLYPLVRGRDLGRYCFSTDGWHQIIPNKHYEEVETEDDFAECYPCAYSYFSNYRDMLVKRSTYKRYQTHLPFYVIYCVGEYSFRKWKVVWMEQQDPGAFRCAVLSDDPVSIVPNKRIIPDHKLYLADLDSQEEAHYLCAYLNAHPVRTWLCGFLHGKQIGTSIFEFMHVPHFNPKNEDHVRLSAISELAHKQRRGTCSSTGLAEDLEKELTELVRKIANSKQ